MKKFITLFAPALVSLVLSASCSIAGDKPSPPISSQSGGEALYGIQLMQDKLALRVKSNGCTEAGHFVVQVNEMFDPPTLLVVRNKPDRCRRMPRIIPLELEFPAGDGRYQLVNVLRVG